MPTMSKVSPQRINLIVEVINHARLTWRLFWDRRVPLSAKMVVPVTIAALVSPIDLIPDFLVGLIGLGVVDDLTLILIATHVLAALAPAEVVAEHLARLRRTSGRPSVETTFRTVTDPS
ncbi:MAG: hypothetical protein KatS3mg060_3124 [Dehalococcoidia bacterium]|nr:MAG: hypothetical protein KatS3mg060_3124 [Dehalococcoidia bacterium]